MLSGVAGVALGYVIASGGDRYVSTHALNASGQDAPAQGQIYNSESLALPIWGSWTRLGVAAVSIGLPLFVASKVKSGAWKSFFQLAGFGALARTAGKAADDGLGYLAGQTQNPMLVQLYSPELAAATAVATSSLTAPAAAPAGTFAGIAKLLGLGRVGAMVPATPTPIGGERTELTCPEGYTLADDGNCYSTPSPSPSPSPSSEPAPCPPCPPSGGGTPTTYPTPTPPVTVPTTAPTAPIPIPVTAQTNTPQVFNPLLCTPEPDPC
jgi:hypothetical protein